MSGRGNLSYLQRTAIYKQNNIDLTTPQRALFSPIKILGSATHVIFHCVAIPIMFFFILLMKKT